jgi:uncharacterized protein (TIGR01777 family)
MNITITGASGFLGTKLLHRLLRDGHTLHVLGRKRKSDLPAEVKFSAWDAMREDPPPESIGEADAVIHLAGEPVAQRWSNEVKRRIRESRSLGTRRLVAAIGKLSGRPRVLVSASASGYYGDRGEEVLTESSAPGNGFLAEICTEWEREARAAENAGVRVASVRIGLVLGKEGGALKQMLTPFRLGVGGRLGSGRQWMPWIHVDDLIEMFVLAMERDVSGPMNGAAPNPVRNLEFTAALARAIHRPAIIPVPRFALDLLFGEMAQIVFASQRMVPKAAEAAGFRFRFAELGSALADLLE